MDGLALETWNPMVQNLLKAGFEVVVFNRTKDKEKN
jgi:3-hydroxyisobutyrate dehydrogenase-like beta-hydroxyacid dehydrogenase